MTSQRACTIGKFASWLVIATVLIAVGIIVYWLAVNTLTTSSVVADIHVTGSSIVKPGKSLTLEAKIIRNRDCRIDIYRMIKRVDGALISNGTDYQVQHVVSTFEASKGSHISPISVDIPAFVAPGKYLLTSQLRYYCNGLDLIWPRFYTEPSVAFIVD